MNRWLLIVLLLVGCQQAPPTPSAGLTREQVQEIVAEAMDDSGTIVTDLPEGMFGAPSAFNDLFDRQAKALNVTRADFDPRDYGADYSDDDDDADAIEDAIDAAVAAGGGTILIAEGTAYSSRPLGEAGESISWRGGSPTATIKALGTTGNLTTRTSDTAGTLTLDSATHNISTGDIFTIKWSTSSKRYQLVAGTVSGASVPFTSATNADNTVLPADETEIVAGWGGHRPLIACDWSGSGGGLHDVQVANLKLEGDYIAPVGLRCLVGVECDFIYLDITRFTRCGVYIDGAQNCRFEAIASQRNGSGNDGHGSTATPFPDCNMALDHYAANNAFYKVQLSASEPQVDLESVFNLVLCQSSTSTIGSNASCFENVFNTCQIERVSGASRGCVLQSNGRLNKFQNCLIACTGTTDQDPMACFVITRHEDGSTTDSLRPSHSLLISDCQITGYGGADTTGVSATMTSAIPLEQPCAIIGGGNTENIHDFISTDTDGTVMVRDYTIGTPGSDFAADLTGSKSPAVLAPSYMRADDTIPSGTPYLAYGDWTAYAVNTTYNTLSAWTTGDHRRLFFQPTAVQLPAYGADKTGTLTTRTSDTAGVLTLGSGHGIEAADTFDVTWNSLANRRLTVTADSVDATTVTFSGGSGDVLPSTSTAVRAIDPRFTINAALGKTQVITVLYTYTGAFITLLPPTNPLVGQELLVEIYNDSGGACPDIYFSTLTNGFRMEGPTPGSEESTFDGPGDERFKNISFYWSGTAWQETSRNEDDR